MKQARITDLLSYTFLILVYIYVLAPALVVIYGSFNSATSFPSPFESATLRWYLQILRHKEFIDSIKVSLIVATCAAAIATLLGTPVAFQFVRKQFPGKDALAAFFMSPLVIPQIVMGLAMLQMLSLFKLPISIVGLILAHAVFVMPYVIRAMMTSLTLFDLAWEEAAMNLGANRLKTLWYVTLPITKAGMTAGFVFSFIMSFVNVPLSLFLTTPVSMTLPIRIYAYMESRIDPFVAAIGALMVIAIFATSFFIEKVLRIRLLV
ncbi:MAG: ABC transporter permease [Chloroflexi bacterium]|nr:ABC transporter permease [Chloroflexota bacterium]MCL5075877.1 ABC transporter permease [Chloroflexota bacterium]